MRSGPVSALASAAALVATSCFVAMPRGARVADEEVVATTASAPQPAARGDARLLLVDGAQPDRLRVQATADPDCFVRHRDTVARRGVSDRRLESLVGGAAAGFAWSLVYSAGVGGLAWLAFDRDHDATGWTLLGAAALPWATLPWAALGARDRPFRETVAAEWMSGAPCPPPRELVLVWSSSLATQHPLGPDGGAEIALPAPDELGLEGYDLPAPRATLILPDGTRFAARLAFDLGATEAAAAWRRRAAAPR